MLGRRSIRIKTMQAIYGVQVEPSLLESSPKRLMQSIEAFADFYHFALYITLQIIDYVSVDAQIKAEKFLKSDQDEVNAKFLSNELVVYLQENTVFQHLIQSKQFEHARDSNVIRQLYQRLIRTDFYQDYLENKLTGRQEDVQVFRDTLKFLFSEELFLELLDDEFISFYDDYDLVKQFLFKQLKKAKKKEFSDLIVQKDEQYKELEQFAQDLFDKTVSYQEEFSHLIRPYLVNWEENRVAVIDMVLIRMALCEFLYFPEIPVKVTLNEYIEIAKQYSTPKSKEFVNGILDKMMKEFTKTGQIQKRGRGLQ